MNLKDMVGLGVLLVTATFGAYQYIASKGYVQEMQVPLKEAVISLDENLKAQTAVIQQNAKVSSRALSLDIAEDLTNMYNRLCYEELDPETRRRALKVTDDWLVEYEDLTGRKYSAGECNQ